MSDFGGRALCPVEDYDDLELREEMVWHAVEEAMLDAGMDLRRQGAALFWLWEDHPWDRLEVGGEIVLGGPALGGRLTIRATTDEHLGADASGLVDLTATLVTR